MARLRDARATNVRLPGHAGLYVALRITPGQPSEDRLGIRWCQAAGCADADESDGAAVENHIDSPSDHSKRWTGRHDEEPAICDMRIEGRRPGHALASRHVVRSTRCAQDQRRARTKGRTKKRDSPGIPP